MIVTRTWLEEYIDLSNISNDELVKTFNKIGLEVDSIKEYKIPAKVVVGEVLECQKHPNADKLNVCKVDIGSEVVQIVCGAANVVDAKYVAVATIGAVLPGDFKIKKAKLRGVESMGMICSSTELGLPKLEDGIMILDDSIGELKVGKELNEYKKVADCVIELELTANRGDCLSIKGVARDLAAAFKKELIPFSYEPKEKSVIGIAKELNISSKAEFPGVLEYAIVSFESIKSTFLNRLRLAFVNIETKDDLDTLIRYSIHDSGVILRAYDCKKLDRCEENRAIITIEKPKDYIIEVKSGNKVLSTVGVNQNEEFKANDESSKVLLEASYIDPDFVVEGVSRYKLECDDLYYNTSRGSEPNISFGLEKLQEQIDKASKAIFSSSSVKVGKDIKSRKIAVNIDELIDIIGFKIPKSEIASILLALGFTMTKISDNSYRVEVPPYRHDIANTHDIAEEVMRIYGIDNIVSKPLTIVEKCQITDTYLEYKAKRDIRQRAVAASFYEAVTYAFASKELLQKYGFEVLNEDLELLNPIVSELNTMRSTLLINLLEAASRNIKYGKKSIPLFEIGTVFNKNREESQKIAFIYSGFESRASVVNSAKAENIDFSSFVEKIGSVIGEFNLENCENKNALMHPYMSADVIKDGKKIGFIAKLHPKVAKDFDLDDTFIAELNFKDIMPKDKNAKPMSNFQAVNKDLSILIDDNLSFYSVAKELNSFKNSEPLLKDFYPLDIYKDSSLGDKKSLTIRFVIQSDTATLSDEEIESVMSGILNLLKSSFNAELR